MIRTAFLRVYLPERALPGQVVVVDHPPMPQVAAGAFGLLAEPMQDDALLAEWRGTRFLCPRFPRIRVLEGLLAFHHAYSDIGGDVIVPEQVAARAADELARLHDRQPSVRSHILTAAWHVPLRWFVAFDSTERELVSRLDGTSIRYRTSLVQATDRVASALDTLRGAGFDYVVTEELDEFRGWLDDFPAASMVELDYGSVAEFFADGELVFDETAAEVHASLEALDVGDLKTAGDRYGEAVARWAPLMAVIHSN
ncbi:MAG: hypothetical protein GWP04_08505 [Gammaproteobacteria bacterium]|nr:hypothetical protein [Gammaproteobacteria bacterium]